jgi:hypothetical protein
MKKLAIAALRPQVTQTIGIGPAADG